MKRLIFFSSILIFNLVAFGQSSFKDTIDFYTGVALLPEEVDAIFPNAVPDMFSYQIKEQLAVIRPEIWVLVEQHSGVCQEEHVYVFSLKGQLLDQLTITLDCDHPGSEAIYESRKGIIRTKDPIIELRYYEEWVSDTNLYMTKDHPFYLPDRLKEGVSFHDSQFEHQARSYSHYYHLTHTKKFQPIVKDTTTKAYRTYPFTYHRLLQAKDLTSYSKDELRKMRNEIFADYGYIFQSEDLQDHFSQQSWYRPVYPSVSEVSPRLNLLEKRNVETIRKVESGK